MAGTTAAVIYDFDCTLCPKSMQEYSFIPELNVSPDKFWAESNALAERENMDRTLAYMYLMLKKANAENRPIRRENFIQHGRSIELYKGADTWFERINACAEALEINLEHYIISAGLTEMLEGTAIYDKFTRVYGSSYLYDINGVAVWPGHAVNFTEKTQYLFRINKGALDTKDERAINEVLAPESRRIPFERMVYIGDGDSDIPCMKLVKQSGGHSVAVYSPQDSIKRAQAQKLCTDGRADYVAVADYSRGGALEGIVKAILEKIAADERVKRLKGVRQTQ